MTELYGAFISYSYSVPNEVGRVGAESSTFIEPISRRKDGILAMFSKQTPAQHTSQSSSSNFRQPIRPSATSLTQAKRKHYDAPASLAKKRRTRHDDAREHHPLNAPTTKRAGKKRLIAAAPRVGEYEDCSDIEIISPPPEREVSSSNSQFDWSINLSNYHCRKLRVLCRLRQAKLR